MVGVGEIHGVVGDLGLSSVAALDVQAERQASRKTLVNTVDLASEWTQVRLNSSAGGHEIFQDSASGRFTEFLVVSVAAELRVLGHQDFLPWEDNLVVVGEPTCVKVRAPVVDLVLGVGHAEKREVLLDGGGSRRGVREDGDVNMVGKAGMEVANVARFGTVNQFSVKTDVVGLAIHPTVPWREGHRGLLLALEGDRWSRVNDVRLASIGHIGDFHVEHVISGEHAVGGLNVPRVRQGAVNGKHALNRLVVMAGQNIGLSNGDVHRFNVENHAFNVVRLGKFVIVVPRLADGGVVKDGLDVQPINAGKELVACDGGHGGFLSIDVGSRIRVNSVLDEGVLRERDVVEADALEAVIDAVAAIVIRLEFEVDVHGGALQGHAFCCPLACIL